MGETAYNYEEQFQAESKSLVAQAATLPVTNQEQYDEASLSLKDVKKHIKKIHDFLDPICDANHKAWKVSTSRRNLALEMPLKAEKLIKKKCGNFLDEQDRIQAEKEAELRNLAAEEERKQREELERQAKVAKDFGKTEKAKELKEEAEDVYIPPPVVEPLVEKAAGQSSTRKWWAVVVDKEKVPRAYLEPNMTLLNARAKEVKGESTIPGVEFKSERVISQRQR